MLIIDTTECRKGVHHWDRSGSGRVYCIRCGAPGIFETQEVDWSKGVTAPGPVRFPTRDEALQDSRCLRWNAIDDAPLPSDRSIIVTRKVATGWLIKRLEKAEAAYIHGQPATHWCEDILGHPASLVKS